MPTISKTAGFRRSVAGVSLMLAPLLFAVAEIAGPEPSGDARAQLASYGQHRGGLIAAVLFGIASSMLFVPALFGLLQQIRRRGAAYAHIAAVMIVYGLIADTALFGLNLMFWEMAKPGMNTGAMATLLDGLQHEKIGASLLLGHFMFAIGIVALGIALWRAHVGPRWAAILVILFPLVDIVLGATPLGTLSSVISDACGIVGFAVLGFRTLATPDAVWDPTPSEAREVRPQPVAA